MSSAFDNYWQPPISNPPSASSPGEGYFQPYHPLQHQQQQPQQQQPYQEYPAPVGASDYPQYAGPSQPYSCFQQAPTYCPPSPPKYAQCIPQGGPQTVGPVQASAPVPGQALAQAPAQAPAQPPCPPDWVIQQARDVGLGLDCSGIFPGRPRLSPGYPRSNLGGLYRSQLWKKGYCTY